jgi:hypothetical protein
MDYYVTKEALESTIVELGRSPQDNGTIEMIITRPAIGERVLVDRGELTKADGLVGDTWLVRGSKATDDGSAHPDMQITLMNSRVLQSISPDRSRWPLAGDQLIVDFDLSHENLPTGQRIAIGRTILEITEVPHNGCAKFTERFGHDAIRFINGEEGRANRRRGIYAKVVQEGTISVGDVIKKIDA